MCIPHTREWQKWGFSTVSTFGFDILHMFQEYNIHQYSICLYKLLFSTGLWSKPSFACTALRGGLGGGQAGCYRPNWVPRHAVCSLRCSAHGRAASCHLRMEVGSWKSMASIIPSLRSTLPMLATCLSSSQSARGPHFLGIILCAFWGIAYGGHWLLFDLCSDVIDSWLKTASHRVIEFIFHAV